MPGPLKGIRVIEMAGLGPDDMDFAQLYDCFSIVPVLELEELGLAPEGEGVGLIKPCNDLRWKGYAFRLFADLTIIESSSQRQSGLSSFGGYSRPLRDRHNFA